MGCANIVDRPDTHLNSQANVHSDPIVKSSKSSLSGEVVAQDAHTKLREVNSAPSIFWHESEQGDQLHERAVRYRYSMLFTTNARDTPTEIGRDNITNHELFKILVLQCGSVCKSVF